jgi:hypothetical protein
LKKSLDSQQVELIGRHRVIESMVRDGVEVAIPVRDNGIDLIAYVNTGVCVACPIQLKAASGESFSVHRKYETAVRLMMCYAWHVHEQEPVIYAMSHVDAHRIAEQKGWTSTASWTQRREYSTTRPSEDLKLLLAEHRVKPGLWPELIRRIATGDQLSRAP